MKKKQLIPLILAGLSAGIINGTFGAGGGMVLVPLLAFTCLSQQEVFPASVAIILPICLVSLLFLLPWEGVRLTALLPYLFGSTAGGVLCGIFGKHIPVKYLHKLLGFFILWGGIRYIW